MHHRNHVKLRKNYLTKLSKANLKVSVENFRKVAFKSFFQKAFERSMKEAFKSPFKRAFQALLMKLLNAF